MGLGTTHQRYMHNNRISFSFYVFQSSLNCKCNMGSVPGVLKRKKKNGGGGGGVTNFHIFFHYKFFSSKTIGGFFCACLGAPPTPTP